MIDNAARVAQLALGSSHSKNLPPVHTSAQKLEMQQCTKPVKSLSQEGGEVGGTCIVVGDKPEWRASLGEVSFL